MYLNGQPVAGVRDVAYVSSSISGFSLVTLVLAARFVSHEGPRPAAAAPAKAPELPADRAAVIAECAAILCSRCRAADTPTAGRLKHKHSETAGRALDRGHGATWYHFQPGWLAP